MCGLEKQQSLSAAVKVTENGQVLPLTKLMSIIELSPNAVEIW